MADTTLTYLDNYCERAGNPAIWAEPFNAVTNLAFIIAAMLVWRTLRRVPGSKRVDLYLLAAALTAIGIGSGLWHTYARQETMLADVIPIALFINIYLLSALRRLFGLTWLKTILLWVLYQAIGMLAQFTLPPDTLHGTMMYIPTWGALAVMSLALYRQSSPYGSVFLRVLGVWTLSLIFRTVDLEVCDTVPIGTHFLWHSLNAWVLWRLSMVLVDSTKTRTT